MVIILSSVLATLQVVTDHVLLCDTMCFAELSLCQIGDASIFELCKQCIAGDITVVSIGEFHYWQVSLALKDL